MNELPKQFQNQIAFFYPTDYKPEERPIVNFEFTTLPAVPSIRFHVTVYASSPKEVYKAQLIITTQDGAIASTANVSWQTITASTSPQDQFQYQALSSTSFLITPAPFKVVENTVAYKAKLILMGDHTNSTATTYFTTHLKA